jgi:hypothetical protein
MHKNVWLHERRRSETDRNEKGIIPSGSMSEPLTAMRNGRDCSYERSAFSITASHLPLFYNTIIACY